MKEQYVESLFDKISYRYDIANFFISFGLEKYWRKKFINYINSNLNYILDACCGTGISTLNILNKLKKSKLISEKLDLNKNINEKINKKTINIKNKAFDDVVYIFGIDFSEQMLSIAKNRFTRFSKFNRTNDSKKQINNINSNQIIFKKNNIEFKVQFKQGDVTNLNFPDNYFDLITIVFGIRNVLDRDKALKEFFRIAKPGGKLIIMEFNYPQKILIRRVYDFYMSKILVNIGGFITKNKKAYIYLVNTIKNFPSINNFKNTIANAGWSDIKIEKLSFETCTIFSSIKK